MCDSIRNKIMNKQKLKIMKTLDLNAYGVSEMNKQEMMETDGGFISITAALWIGFGAGAIVAIICYLRGRGGDDDAAIDYTN